MDAGRVSAPPVGREGRTLRPDTDAAVQDAVRDAAASQAALRLLGAGTQLRPYSQEILEAAYKATNEVYDEVSAKNADFKKVIEAVKGFRNEEYLWFQVAEYAYDTFMIRARARDAMPSVQLDPRFPVIPVRGLVNGGTRRFAQHQAETVARVQSGELTREQGQMSIEQFWAGALRRAVIEGDVEHGSVMAGQSVGMVTSEQPAAAIIAEALERDYRMVATVDEVRGPVELWAPK